MAEAAKTKSKKGLMIGLVLLFVFVGAGVVFGLAMSGKINIPGVTPKKKPVKPPTPKAKSKKLIPEEPPQTTSQETISPASIKKGAAKLAEVWDEMPTDKLIRIAAKWKPSDLAVVMNEMDPAKVAEALGKMDPKTASNISQQMRVIAAQIPAE
jgi:MgtE intracellular N domain